MWDYMRRGKANMIPVFRIPTIKTIGTADIPVENDNIFSVRSLLREKVRGANRCMDCNLFKKWEEIKLVGFIPDSDFGAEDYAYRCLKCMEYLKQKIE